MTKKRKVRASKNSADKNSIRKIYILMINILLFAVLCTASFFLYRVSITSFYLNLFFLLTLLLGFISIAFFIALLVTIFAKAIKRK